MRKTLSLLLAAMLALSILVAVSPVRAMGTKTFYVACSNGGDLNLREQPSKNSRSLIKIPYGTALEISDLNADNTWGFCSYKTFTGWVMMSFLSETPPDPGKSAGEKARENIATMNTEFEAMERNQLISPYQVIVSTAKTNTLYHLRWAPYFSAYSMRNDVVNGEVFTVTAEGKNWLQVQDNRSGRTAYIARSITRVWSSGLSN